ncbi:tRNA (adenosine(37)-N6)-dimethylallyltransferase MiaA [Cytophaga hutchinsonii]|uniref:tRNA dimethylallyltransferase n=1 Tax=Cytophaga hutchinsonii (strain ATCC 33406 / DSM 1761 / CIP 103989 / NBRC 15051 / NCIMB 9469 / D465) TaxID=269798 RepID=MIAA_CYTH3|nr:tRNA (adenosine(37)-N6)-dimethylallyltransferase MiaA [Cytophaga hutchinsonii]Q11RE0.1 RecName: Full=tRNA dimethylallyltransferase; AltName: Full=Dimethylallyl diphosphate:tRNA dimethylallyltransferase; Short=DMAPP:tRNA dimethylallyltransferase; Short=DMATase; AltName: Full=Isopentenyl-diphosphate:tRNA isopentenyltransferase; Short=IPP transferase; Short=IPPT; Short=IPTase [Cytophaga hutchinsonii ATCC 33406]ABG60025.1 tRNA isopentenyltransferase (delta(2)-isopentenylpyrophosphate tRNA-adenosin
MSFINKYVIVVVGPTAAGKTALAVSLAKRFNTAVLSADSRQVFKELSIGTAKATMEEQDGVPHYFVDSISIEESFNAGMFEREGLQLLDTLFLKHDVVIVCGGTGLYVKALLEGMDALPQADPELREALNREFEQRGLEVMTGELKEIDPETHAVIDLKNPLRVFRAIEVYRQTGKPLSSFKTGAKQERPFKTIRIGLNMPREELYARIDRRMDRMLEAGLEKEARDNIQYRNYNALQTVGYSEIFGFIDGLYDREEMIRLLKRNSRRYAKRQLTWFSKDAEVKWFHPGEITEITTFIEAKLQE